MTGVVLEPMGSRTLASVTIHDVADRAGVSIKTVSRVLNNEPNVSPSTRDKVLGAVEQLQYRPNLSARSLAGSKSFLICHFYDNPSPAYVTDVQFGATSMCRKAGYHLIVEPVDNTDQDLARSVRAVVTSLQLDGVIATPPVSDNATLLDMLEQINIPVVRFAPHWRPERSASVSMDDERAAYEMTGLLIEMGHREIGFIRGHPEHGASDLRFKGHAAAMRDQGLPLRPERVQQGYFSYDSGVAAAEVLLADKGRPTAIFASNDDMALGVFAVAHRLGLSLPDQLSIVGFDDVPSAAFAWPQLTTVRQPIIQMAAAATEMLISGEAAAANWRGAPPARVLDFEIVVRDSAKSPSN